MIYSGNCCLGDLFKSRREKGRAGLPLLSVTMTYGLVERDELERKQETSLTPDQHLLVKSGDIAYNMMRMWQGAFGLAGAEGLVSPAYIVLKPTKKIDPLFASYLLKSPRLRYLLWAYSYGITNDRLRLYYSDFARIPALVPSIEIQRMAGSCIETWDDAIRITERLLANSRMQRLSLLSKLLRVPAATTEVLDRERSNSLPPSVRAGIPKLPATPPGWSRINLGAHLREVHRPLGLASDQKYTLVTVKRSRGGVKKRGLFLGDEVKTKSQFIVKAGDFLISKRQIVHGACGIVPPELDGAIVSNEYSILSTDGQIDLDFLRYLSESIYFQQTCFHSSIGVHVEKMIFKTERWLAWPFNIPPLLEQRRIVEVLDAAGGEVTATERQLSTLRMEKQALMQKLLTGKRRVHLPKTAEATSP